MIHYGRGGEDRSPRRRSKRGKGRAREGEAGASLRETERGAEYCVEIAEPQAQGPHCTSRPTTPAQCWHCETGTLKHPHVGVPAHAAGTSRHVGGGGVHGAASGVGAPPQQSCTQT